MSKEIKINAKGKKLGRMATEIARVLQGKHDPSYNPRLPGDVSVVVENVEKVDVSGDKYNQKVYYRHSGRPGQLKEVPYKKMIENDPEKVVQLAVKNMLPKNRLRKRRLKRLKFSNSDNE